jgi:hypothetical protein
MRDRSDNVTKEEDVDAHRKDSREFLSLSSKKLAHGLKQIRSRALLSLKFKIEQKLIRADSCATDDVLMLRVFELITKKFDDVSYDAEDYHEIVRNSVSVIVRIAREAKANEYKRTLAKIGAEALLRRAQADFRVNEREDLVEEIEVFFKDKRARVVERVEEGVGGVRSGLSRDYDEYDVDNLKRSFNAKEEEIRRRLRRYEDEALQTSTSGAGSAALLKYRELPRLVKCISADGSLGLRLFAKVPIVKVASTSTSSTIGGEESRRSGYNALRKYLTQYERALKTTSNVDVLVGILRALREGVLLDCGVKAFLLANPENGIVRSVCDILMVSSSNSNVNNIDVDGDVVSSLKRSMVVLKREALLFLGDVMLGIKSTLYENNNNNSSDIHNTGNKFDIQDDEDINFSYSESIQRREVIFSRDFYDDCKNGDFETYALQVLPISHAIAESFIACARYPALCGETCELFERCFLEVDVLELSGIDKSTNGAHPSSLVRLKGYLRAWNVSGAKSVGDFGANALCFVTCEKLARFVKPISNSSNKFTSVDDIYDDVDDDDELGDILEVNDSLVKSCVETLDTCNSHDDAHNLLDAMFIMRALGGSKCLLRSLASNQNTVSGIWERFLLVKPKTVNDTVLWSRMLRLFSGCLRLNSSLIDDVEEIAAKMLAYAIAKVGAFACRQALSAAHTTTTKSHARGNPEVYNDENINPNVFITSKGDDDTRPVWIKHPIVIERELERCGDAGGVRRLAFQEVLRDVHDCLKALQLSVKASSSSFIVVVDVVLKSDELLKTFSEVLRNSKKKRVEYGALVACCDSIHALAAMAKRTGKRKYSDSLCEQCLPDLLLVIERTSTSIVYHLDSKLNIDDIQGGEALLESSLLATLELCKNTSSPAIWAEKFASFENTSNILLSLVARSSSILTKAFSFLKSPRCAALAFDLVSMLSSAFMDQSEHSMTILTAAAVTSCESIRELIFTSTWFDAASLHAIDVSNAPIARFRAAVCVAQIVASVTKDEKLIHNDEEASLDPGSINNGRISMVSVLSRRKLWINFAKLLEGHETTDALVARGISSAMLACARVDVVTAKESFLDFHVCLKNWLRPSKKTTKSMHTEVFMHRCATSTNISKLLGLFIIGDRLNNVEHDYALKAESNSPIFYALFDVLESAKARKAEIISASEICAASAAALSMSVMLDMEYNTPAVVALDGDETARGHLCETTCALLELSLVKNTTIPRKAFQGFFALLATMFSCKKSSRDALTFDPEEDEEEFGALPKTQPPLIEINDDIDQVPLGIRLCRVLEQTFESRFEASTTTKDDDIFYQTVISAFQNVLAHCASAKAELIRCGSLERLLKRVSHDSIDVGGISFCMQVLKHASYSDAIENDNDNDNGNELITSSMRLQEAAIMVKNATLTKYNGISVFEKLFVTLFTSVPINPAGQNKLSFTKQRRTELRDSYLGMVANFILESDDFKRGICNAIKNSGETSLFNRLVSFLFREKEKTTRLRDPLSFAAEKYIPSTTLALGMALLSSLSAFSLTRAQLSRSIFIEACCECIARFTIASGSKNRDLKLECEAALDALCVFAGSDIDGAKLLLRSSKINIIGLLVDCYEYADNVFDENLHASATGSKKKTSFLLTKQKILALLHNLSFAGDVAKAHFCAKTKSLDLLIDSLENSFDSKSKLLAASTVLSLINRGSRVVSLLHRADRAEKLRRCSYVFAEKSASNDRYSRKTRELIDLDLVRASQKLRDVMQVLCLEEQEKF